MASDNEASCINDPNFAVICGFLEKFGVSCGITGPDFMELQEMLENTNEVPPALIDLHIKLLRKVRRSVSSDRWERVLIKVCHIYCTQDAWELERFGYKKARLTSKLRILKNLCEMQFDLNQKFKAEVNRQTANELRSEPIGRDKFGHSYWYQIDEICQLRVYREDPDEETWTLVARDREGLVRLIQQLSDGDVGELVLNEDSNSLEIEKPITDTGQVSSSVSTCEAEADVDADADVDASSTGNEDSKESVSSELKMDVADNKTTQPEAEAENLTKENNLKITINKSDLVTVKKVEAIVSPANSSSFKGTDVLSKKKKSINELAENLTKYKSIDPPNKAIIQEHQYLHQQVQEQEMDLSMKKPKPVMKVKHFASLSEPPVDFEHSDDDEDDEDSYESDEIKLPSHMKQPRLDRPTLLGNAKKKKTYSEEEEEEEEDEEDEYGEPIEEPVMLIQGEGSGRECKNENIQFSDVIEESVMYFYGEGSGRECDTGNTAKEEENSASAEKKDDTHKDAVGGANENALPDDSKSHKIGTVMIDVKSVDRVQVIPDVVQLKKVSRWDVGKPNENPSTNISIMNEDDSEKNNAPLDASLHSPNLPKPPKQSVFFFGPQADCFQFNPPISTHFQCTKPSPKKIGNDEKSENVPITENKSEKQNNKCLKENSVESTLDNVDDLKKEHNETTTNLEHSIDSSKRETLIGLEKESESERNKKDDENTDDKSETLSETLDSLETLIENDDTAVDDKCNKDATKASVSDAAQNVSSIDEPAAVPVDKTQIDEVSSSDNDKCEIDTTDGNICVPQDTSASSVSILCESNIESTTSKTDAPPVENQSTLNDSVTITEPTLQSPSKLDLIETPEPEPEPEPEPIVQSKKNVENISSNTSENIQRESNVSDKHLDQKSTPEINQEESLKTTEDICLEKCDDVSKTSAELIGKTSESAINDAKDNMEQGAIEKSTNIMDDKPSEHSEHTLQTSEDNRLNESAFTKETKNETIVNNDEPLVVSVSEQNSNANLIEKAPSDINNTIPDNKLHSIPDTTVEHDSVKESKIESNEISLENLDKSNVENKSGTEILIADFTKTRSETTNKMENILKEKLNVESVERRSDNDNDDDGNSSKIEKISKLEATTNIAESTSETKVENIEKTEQPPENTSEQMSVAESSENNKIELDTAVVNVNLLENDVKQSLVDTLKENKLESIDSTKSEDAVEQVACSALETEIDLKNEEKDLSKRDENEEPTHDETDNEANLKAIPLKPVLNAQHENTKDTPVSDVIDKDNKTDDCQSVLEERLVLPKEKLSINQSESHDDASTHTKDDLQQGNEDVRLKDDNNKEIDKCDVQETKPDVPCSAQIPEMPLDKDKPSITEKSSINETDDEKSTVTVEGITDDVKSKCDVENIPKVAKSNAIESQNSEIICDIQSVDINKKSKFSKEKNFSDMNNIDKTETLENIVSSKEEPCTKETPILLKVTSNAISSEIKEKTDNLEDNHDKLETTSNLEATRICPKDKPEQVDDEPKDTTKSNAIQNEERIFGAVKDKNELFIENTSIVANCENVVMPTVASVGNSKKYDVAECIKEVTGNIPEKNQENKDATEKNKSSNELESNLGIPLNKQAHHLSEPPECEESESSDSFEQGNQYSEESNDEEINESIHLADISTIKKNEPENIDLKNISLIKDEKLNLPPSISIKAVKSLHCKSESESHIDDSKDKKVAAKSEDSKEIVTDPEEKPKLVCIDISKLTATAEEDAVVIEASKLDEPIKIDNDDDVIDIPETDPLAIPDEEIVLKKEEGAVKTLSLATFKLDDTDESIDATSALPAPIARALRNRKIALNVEPVKRKPKENKVQKAKNVCEDETSKTVSETPPKVSKPQTARRGRGRSTGMPRERTQSTSELNNDAETDTTKTDGHDDDKESSPPPQPQPQPQPKKTVKKKSRILGLEIDPSAIIEVKSDEGEVPTTRSSVRQSRRIAQLKIREEAMQMSKLDDIAAEDTFKKKKKSKKDEDKEFKVDKKNKKHKGTTDEDDSDVEIVEEGRKKKHKKKRKHQDLKKLFNMERPWQSSTDDSSSQNEEEEEEEEVEEELTEDEAVLKSDHEFSPESDLENNTEVQPLRRARTVKKESDTEDPSDEHACQKCSKADHPEWILLCDKCDCGWHCSCLRPALLVIPEGDWFCPPCQHIALIEALKKELGEYDKKMNRLEMEVRRKERLAYVGISLNNVLPTMKEPHDPPREREKEKRQHEVHSNESADSSSGSDDESNSSESSSDEDSEPIYQLRQRRQAQTYRFNDYDELINSAIQDEIEAVKGAGNQGRGKDIATIVNAEKEEEAKALLDQNHEQQQQQNGEQENVEKSVDHVPVAQAPVVPVEKENEEHEEEGEDESDDELRVVPKHTGKKKHRKLNALDVSSEDDNADDEDFKGTSDEEEEEFEDLPSEDSEDMEIGRRGKGRSGPIRRSTRARTQRYDRDFINDDSDAEDDSRRKKKRSIWDETESEESDKDWGRRKRNKKQRNSSATTTIKKSRKRKKRRDESDPEADVKRSLKKSRIKYGGLSDSDDELLTRRTRGKKINYIDALGSDSDDEKQKTKRIIESEDEYVANEDEDEEQEQEQEQEEPLLDDEHDESDSEDGSNPNRPVKVAKGRGKAGLHRIIKTTAPPAAVGAAVPLPPVFMKKPDAELPSSIIPENIPVIAANPENLNEEEVEKMMMESEEYANKQLELMAIQLAKEKQKRVLDNQMMPEVKQPKKRGRKRKVDIEAAAAAAAAAANHIAQNVPSIIGNAASTDDMNRISPMRPDADILPTVVSELHTTPTKRRGRGKGKKTLEKEAAASGVDIMQPEHVKSVAGTIIPPANTTIDPTSEAPPNIPETSILAGKLGIAAPPQPFSQSQPTPSVITRMLQSQPISVQNFPPGAPTQLPQKYFPGMHEQGAPRNAPPPQFSRRVPSPYRQPSPNITIYAGMRPGPANSPHRLRTAGPPPPPPPPPPSAMQQMFHSTHHSMDPSPSGGGPINISQAAREGSSPHTPQIPQMIAPPVSSPMAKDGVPATAPPPPPPPPPYSRAQIPVNVNRFSPGESSPGPSIPSPIRHHLFPQMQQSSPPPPRPPPPPGNFSPYHPPPPPNYHYGAYPPAPSLAAADDALPPTDYQGSPYPEPYNTTDGAIQSSEGSNSKPFDEEGSGEFGGLVSYFSSQREDDLDT